MRAPRTTASGLMAWEETEEQKEQCQRLRDPGGMELFSVRVKGPEASGTWRVFCRLMFPGLDLELLGGSQSTSSSI